jgi:hypothetical protein
MLPHLEVAAAAIVAPAGSTGCEPVMSLRDSQAAAEDAACKLLY